MSVEVKEKMKEVKKNDDKSNKRWESSTGESRRDIGNNKAKAKLEEMIFPSSLMSHWLILM